VLSKKQQQRAELVDAYLPERPTTASRSRAWRHPAWSRDRSTIDVEVPGGGLDLGLAGRAGACRAWRLMPCEGVRTADGEQARLTEVDVIQQSFGTRGHLCWRFTAVKVKSRAEQCWEQYSEKNRMPQLSWF
jgi:hypothetical protein